MHLEQVSSELQKLSKQNDLIYSLGKAASKEDIFRAEQKLDVVFPARIKLFYESYNGLRVEAPRIEVLPLERLRFVKANKLNFATIDSEHQLYFNTARINEAEQWDIISENEYLVTKTMASFWSNKIWSWIKQRREFWKEQFKPMNCPVAPIEM